jgi:DNA polymerase/3'-5' exonuclease PolX
MDKEVSLILIGAGISLISSVITLTLQHFYSLRAERIKNRHEQLKKREEDLRYSLIRGVAELESLSIQKQIKSGQNSHKLFSPVDTTRFTLWKYSIEKKFNELDTLFKVGDFTRIESTIEELDQELKSIMSMLEELSKEKKNDI